MIRRHLPAERALNLLNSELAPLLAASDADQRHGAVRTLAGACWCQTPQLPLPPSDMQKCLTGLADQSLPKLLADADASVLSASAVLFASAARLHAAAGSLDASAAPWASWAEKLATILAAEPKAGRLSPEGLAIALHGLRHYGAVASASAKPAGVAQLAAVAAAQGLSKTEAVAQAGERALAALLSTPEGTNNEGDLKKSLEACASALKDPAAAKTLRDYASKRLKSLSQLAPTGSTESAGGFVWDF